MKMFSKNVGRKKKQLTNEQPVKGSFGGYTFKVVVAGNCVLCGKRIDDNGIFLCKDCQSKNKTQKGEIKKIKIKTNDVDKCFLCDKEIQRDSIPRIKPKLNKIKLNESEEQHPICDACGNLLAIAFRIYEGDLKVKKS